MSELVKREDGIYVEIPREKMHFVNKEAEMLFDATMEIEQLQQENKILRENAEHNDKVVDKVNWERQLLQQRIDKAIEYILDGRYGEDDDYESISLYIPKLLEILGGDKE